MKGHKDSDETRRKKSLAHKGKPGYWLGKKHSLASNIKRSEKQRGERHYNWKGGITSLRLRVWISYRYRQWRSDIMTRDNFTCSLCSKRGGQLQVDHYPDKFSDIIGRNKIKTVEQALECEELWNLNNGRTLCKPCHLKTPTWGHRKI